MGTAKNKGRLSPPRRFFEQVPWLRVYLTASAVLEFLEQYLNWRELRRCQCVLAAAAAGKPVCDKRLKTVCSQEELVKTNSYTCDRLRFRMFTSVFQTTLSLLATAYFLGPYIWRLSGRLLHEVAAASPLFSVPVNEYSQSLIYLGLQFILQEIIQTPFQLYGDFVIEERHGFNKKTLGLFVKDKLLGCLITAVIGCPIVCASIWLIKWGGDNFYLWLWAFSVVVTIVLMAIYPNVIAPLFNKFEPLKDEELRREIEALAKQLNFPLGKLYQMDGSKRSGHSTAYFYGLWWSKQIVFYDTMLHLPRRQILAVLGHEMGHWKLNHTLKVMVASFLQLFFVFYLFGLVMKSDQLFDQFGYIDTRASIIGLKLFSNIFVPVNAVVSLLMTIWSRHNEYEADAFAVLLGYGEDLKAALLAVHVENKANPDPDPWYSWWNNNHPSLVERMNAIDALLQTKKRT